MNKKTRKIIACVIAGLLAFLMLFSLIAPVFAADAAAEEAVLTVEYDQKEARRMLDLMNAFRTGDDAWYWNADNTEKVESKGEPLAYSYALEEIAMQRAAETALSFSHTRTDGTSCYTAAAADGTTSFGENIAAGNASAEDTFAQWREDSKTYSGQGHRRNMLKTRYAAVGIGHAVVNGYHYWVQEFGYSTDSAPETAPADGEQAVSVLIADSRLTGVGEVAASPESVTVVESETAELPVVTAAVTLDSAWPGGGTLVTAPVTWAVSGTDTAVLSDGAVYGVQAGETALTASAFGKPVSVPVTVKAAGGTPEPEPEPEPEPVDVSASGTCGEDLSWTLDVNGLLTISGTGVTDVPGSDGMAWQEDSGEIQALRVTRGVTGIGAEAFRDCTALTRAEIADSVATVGESAFADCEALTDVYYGGTAAQWKSVTVEAGNEPLINAEIHFTGTAEPEPEPEPDPNPGSVTEITGVSCFTFEDVVTVNVTARAGADGQYLLCAMACDGDGYPTDLQIQEVSLTREVSVQSLSLSTEEGASVRVFLLDENLVPLSPCKETTV